LKDFTTSKSDVLKNITQKPKSRDLEKDENLFKTDILQKDGTIKESSEYSENILNSDSDVS